MECAPKKDEQDKPTATYDDMLLFLATHKTEKLAVINRAKNTFGECAKQQSVIRSRSDLFISDVFFNHKFFPSPSLPQTGKRKQKVKKVELLPNVISSKEWKEYISYYGSNTFHIDWVDAAFNCASTAGFTSEDAGGASIPHPFDPDFSTAYCGGGSTPGVGVTGAAGAAGTDVVAGKECVGTEGKNATLVNFDSVTFVVPRL